MQVKAIDSATRQANLVTLTGRSSAGIPSETRVYNESGIRPKTVVWGKYLS